MPNSFDTSFSTAWSPSFGNSSFKKLKDRFDPILWYDAQDRLSVQHINGRVVKWKNKGTTGITHDLVQGTADKQPVWTGNYINNQETRSMASEHPILLNGDLSYLAILYQNRLEANNIFSTSTAIHRQNSTNNFRQNLTTSAMNASTSQPLGQTNIVGFVYNSTTPFGKFYLNNVQDGTFVGTNVATSDLIRLFNSTLSTGTQNYLGEILVWDKELTVSEMTSVYNIMKEKWSMLKLYDESLSQVIDENYKYVYSQGFTE